MELFVVIEPEQDHQPALLKAIELARKLSGSIHCFVCVYQEIDSLDEAYSRRANKHELMDSTKDWLQQLIKRHKIDGLPVTTEVFWNQHLDDSIVQEAARCGSDIILKSSAIEESTRLGIFHHTDWTLLRHSPCPILMLKDQEQSTPAIYQRVLLSLDLESQDEFHMRLNHVIVNMGQKLATQMGVDLYLVHAQTKQPADYSHILGDYFTDEPVEPLFSYRFDIPENHLLIRKGRPQQVICEAAEDAKADLLIIGTLGRSGISGTLIGNTSEKVLKEINCDVLMVM